MPVPSAAELLEARAREAERLRILLMAKECKSLDELIEKLESKLSS